MKLRPFHILLLCVLTLSACAFEAGSPWGIVESSIALDHDHLDVPATITLDAIQLTVPAVHLYSSTSSGGSNQPFDPTNPPPGYSQCHGGHCHAADGSLPTYAEVAAKTSGQNTTQSLAATTVFTEKLTSSHELTGELQILQRATLNTVEAEVSTLHIQGTAQRDGKTHPLTIEVSLKNARLQSPIHLIVDRDHPHHQPLPLVIELPHDLLETIDFDNLSTQTNGSISINTKNNAAQAAAIAQAFEHDAIVFVEDDHDHDDHDDHDH